jgi:phosphatidylserine/phosphatidylglycerophosphate/cardiolipin synthase-like enzyme
VQRKTADLIYFPTGGGKTEAYLGLIAFTLVLRRMRGRARADEGRGVAVVLRYTLRLLTLDQLGRVCSLHAKCVAVDGERAFISSANFTARGQERNIEAGVLINDAAFARQLERQWMSLVETGFCLRHERDG